MKKITKAIILCGGMGTRFLPITKAIPKEMLPILDKPILHLILEKLKDAGIKDVLIIVGRGKECILNYFDKDIELETTLQNRGKLDLLQKVVDPTNLMNIYYLRQKEPLGTGYSLLLAKNFLKDESFLYTFGDEYIFETGNSYLDLIEDYYKCNKNLIAVSRVDKAQVYKYGIIKFKENKENLLQVESIVEKPKVEDAPSDLSYMGTAIFDSEIFKILEKIKFDKQRELGVTEGLEILAKRKILFAKIITKERFDLGDKLGFVKANIKASLEDENIKKDMLNYLSNIILNQT